MITYRYSGWGKSQTPVELDAEKLMDELGGALMSTEVREELAAELGRDPMPDGDLSNYLRLMQRRGIKDSQGKRSPGIEELLKQLRQQRQSQLDKYELDSVVDGIRQEVEDILNLEREGIGQKVEKVEKAEEEAKGGAGELSSAERQELLQAFETMATQNLDKLAKLPQDISGQIKGMTQYKFMDEEISRQFQGFIDTLKRNALEGYGRELVEKLKSMDASSLANTRRLIEALNQMLEQRRRGEEPDFAKFMEEFGGYFGGQPPKNLDELIERLQSQIAQAQSLLESLSPDDRQSLENLWRPLLDEAVRDGLEQRVANLEALSFREKLRKRYFFSGKEPLSYTEALKLMEKLQKIDKLEVQLRGARHNRSLDVVDEELVEELIGEEAAAELERLHSIPQVLEEKGYIRKKDGRYELTPRAIRKIGQKALEDIFAQLRKGQIGEHKLQLRGGGGERMVEETKKYESGDELYFHLQRTIMNSLYREPKAPPIRLSVEDFEVCQTEGLARSATVLMLDLSASMPARGNFEAAKRVAIALDSLMRSQYPEDTLYVVGFSSYARQIRKEELSSMTWDKSDPYTNMQHAFYLARKLFTRERCINKQIILVSDGEPTAYFEGGNLFYQYPPTSHIVDLTLKEVRNCTRSGVVINTFMLESERFLSDFVTQMARINKGRVFFTSAEKLGRYLLVDYIAGKKKLINDYLPEKERPKRWEGPFGYGLAPMGRLGG